MQRVFVRSITALACGVAILAASPAAAVVTVGNPAAPASATDGCDNCTFVLNQAFGVAGLTLSSYQFFGSRTADVTPLLLTRSDAGSIATFTIVGIGQTKTGAAGLNNFLFDRVEGTSTTAANSYFGFAYGTFGGGVTFDYMNPPTNGGAFVAPDEFAPTLGNSFSNDSSVFASNSYNALNDRVYSINATAVPEPASWAMMIGGFGLVGASLRRRQRVSVRFG